MTNTQDSGVTSTGNLPDGNSDIHFSLLKTQSLNTMLQITQTLVAFLKKDFFFNPSPAQTKNICFCDVPRPCKKIELFKGFCIVHILSKEQLINLPV